MKTVLTHWTFDYLPLLMVTGLCILYALIGKFSTRSILCFWAAIGFTVLCFCSPLHILSANYLFSAHMIVHVILLLCVGPLLLLSLPHTDEHFSRLFLFLKRLPIAGWLTGVGIMWIWHVPGLFNATMATAHYAGMSMVHAVETFSLVMAGILFAAPVIHPNRKFRIEALTGVVYLFTACLGCSILGLLITFAPPDTYHHFLSPVDEYGFNKIITEKWGLTQLSDQQAAGLIMWVPCCFIYVTGALYLLIRWLKRQEDDGERPPKENKI